ncbi:MAG: helix-turn-helix transcriptional regulator [Pseudomonadota bacterium]
MTCAFGVAMKEWRARRRMSQLDLGLSAEVSPRHISFLETGRARPSRTMVLRLCDELEVPRAARNQLLAAAGFAHAYAERALTETDMRPVRLAVDWMLERHAPFPAFAVDRHWNLVELNRTAAQLFSGLGLGPGDSLIDALASNHLLREALANLDEVLAHVTARLRTESAHLGGDPVLDAGIAALGDGTSRTHPDAAPAFSAFVPTRYRLDDATLSLFSTVAQFGATDDIALSELKIEMLFPADEPSRRLLVAMAESS